MKSAKDKFGCPAAFFICCLKNCKEISVCCFSSITCTSSLSLLFAGQNPKTALGVGAAAIGIPYAIKTKNAIEDRRMKRELHESEIKKNAAYSYENQKNAENLQVIDDKILYY